MVNQMIKNCLLSILALSLVVFSAVPVLSAQIGLAEMFYLNQDIEDIAVSNWLPRISRYTIGLLWTTSMIAFAIGCKDLAISSGIQLEGIISLFVRFAFLSGVMYWLLRNPRMFFFIPNSLERLGGYIATGSTGNLSYTRIASAFTGIMSPIYKYYQTLDWLSPGLLLVCLILLFFISCLCVLFVTTIILVRIETIFIIIGGMFSAAFFVLGYFRDIFMGYIKAIAMNGVKLLLLSLCINLLADTIDSWKGQFIYGIDYPAMIYDTVFPITLVLMAFYIVIKSIPQYAVAIFTGHATADGGLARAAVMAGIGTAATVWNVSRGISQTAINTASTTHKAAQAYNNVTSPVRDAIDKSLGGNYSRMTQDQKKEMAEANSAGIWAAAKTLMSSPIGGRFGGGGNSPGGFSSSGSSASGGMKAGDVALLVEKYDKKVGIMQNGKE